jgi:hypothetical protein
MSLNKLLCKYLDRDGKGYVTMGNLITATSVLTTSLVIVMGYLRGATTIMRYWDGHISTTLIAALGEGRNIDAIFLPLTIVGTGLILAIILSFVIALLWISVEDIWSAKIVKCDRKEGD